MFRWSLSLGKRKDSKAAYFPRETQTKNTHRKFELFSINLHSLNFIMEKKSKGYVNEVFFLSRGAEEPLVNNVRRDALLCFGNAY